MSFERPFAPGDRVTVTLPGDGWEVEGELASGRVAVRNRRSREYIVVLPEHLTLLGPVCREHRPGHPTRGAAVTDPTGPVDLDAVTALCDAATPGPWVAEVFEHRCPTITSALMWPHEACTHQGKRVVINMQVRPGGWYEYREPRCVDTGVTLWRVQALTNAEAIELGLIDELPETAP